MGWLRLRRRRPLNVIYRRNVKVMYGSLHAQPYICEFWRYPSSTLKCTVPNICEFWRYPAAAVLHLKVYGSQNIILFV